MTVQWLHIADDAIFLHGEEAQAVGVVFHLYLDTHGTFGHIRIGTHLTDVQLLRSCLQFDASYDTVPVALGLVSNAMRVLSDADILDTVIYLDGYLVLFAQADVFGYIILMGYGETHLVTYLLAVDIDGGLDMRSFQEQGNTLFAPGTGDIDGTAVSCIAHEVFLRCQEERELHIS